MICSRCGMEHSDPGIKLMLRGFRTGDARQIGVRQRTMPGEFDAACFVAELDEAEQRYQQRLVEVQAAQASKEDVPWGQRWVVARLRLAGYEVTKPTTEGKRVRGQYGGFAYVWETNKYVLFRAIVVEASPAAKEVYQTLQPHLGDRIHPANKVLKHKNYHRMDIFLTGPSDYEALAQHLPLLERAAPGDAEGRLITIIPLEEETECIWSDRDRHQTPHAAAWLATVRHARSGEIRQYRVCDRDLGRLRQLYGREVAFG